MSMTSLVKNCGTRPEHNLEGYNYACDASHLQAFSLCPPPSTLLPYSCIINDPKLYGQPSKSCPTLEGSFTPASLVASSACSSQADHDVHSSYVHQNPMITHCINADNLPFCTPGAPFAMDFSLSEESQLLEVMGLQRKLPFCSCSYGDHQDHDFSQETMQAAAAAANDEKERFLQSHDSYSYGDDLKLRNLARSFTFPPAGTARSDQSGCDAIRSAPVTLISSQENNAEVRNSHTVVKQLNEKRGYKETSSAATTSCSNGDENEILHNTSKLSGVKLEVSEDSQCMLGNYEQQGCIEQTTALNSKGYKQTKKRIANMNNLNASAKAARLETPPDVVHVRARRGQATDSHSLAERVRREKISQRMKVLQEIVPGCHKVLGKAMMLDEIINYVKSLQKQVEFLSMKLAVANQVGTKTMIANEVNFLVPNVEFFGDFSAPYQVMKSESVLNSLTQ